MDFPVFSPDGTMLGNQTSSQGVAPSGNTLADIPALPKLPDPPAGTPKAETYKGWLPKWMTDPINKATEAIDSVDPTSKTFDAGKTASTIAGVDIGSVLPRIAIVILGFIFVAVGLTMFSRGAINAALPIPHR